MRSSPEKSDRRVGAPTCCAGAAAPPISLWSPSSIPTHSPKKDPHKSPQLDQSTKTMHQQAVLAKPPPNRTEGEEDLGSLPRYVHRQVLRNNNNRPSSSHADGTRRPPPQQLLLGGDDAITSILRSAAHHASRRRIGRRGIGRSPALPARSEERTARIGARPHGEGAPTLAPLLGAAGQGEAAKAVRFSGGVRSGGE